MKIVFFRTFGKQKLYLSNSSTFLKKSQERPSGTFGKDYPDKNEKSGSGPVDKDVNFKLLKGIK